MSFKDSDNLPIVSYNYANWLKTLNSFIGGLRMKHDNNYWPYECDILHANSTIMTKIIVHHWCIELLKA